MARGRNVINQSINLEGGDEIVAMLRKMGEEGEAAAKELERAFRNTEVAKGVAGNIAKLRQNFAALQKAGAGVAQSFGNVATRFRNVGYAASTVRNRFLLVTAAATGAAAAFTALVKGSLDSIGEISDLSESLGISAEKLQAFRLLAADIGIEFGDLTKGVAGLNDGLKELRAAGASAGSTLAEGLNSIKLDGGEIVSVLRGVKTSLDGSSKSAEKLSEKGEALRKVFQRMGLSVTKTTTELDVLQVLGDYFKDVATEGEKLGLAIDVFGQKLGPKMVRFLNLGGDALVKFQKELQGLGLLLSNDQVTLGDAASDAIAKLFLIFDLYREKFAVAIAPGILRASEAIIKTLAENRAAISAFIEGAANRFVSVMTDIITLISGGADERVENKWLLDLRDGFIAVKDAASEFFFEILIPAFQKVREFADIAAKAINSVFGTNFSGDALLIGAVVTQLVGGFGLLIAVLGTLGNTIVLVFRSFAFLLPLFKTLVALWPVLVGGASSFIGILGSLVAFIGPQGLVALGLLALAALFYVFWDDIVAYSMLAWDAISSYFSEQFAELSRVPGQLAEAAQQAFAKAKSNILALWASITTGIRDLWNGAVGFIRNSVDGVVGLIQRVVSSIARAITHARRLIGLGNSNNGASGGGGGGSFASGGFVSGPGSSTSDSIPAWLSNGEFVIRAAAVRKYGVDMLRMINGLRADRLFESGFPQFAMGGPVGIPVPAIVGGQGASGRPVMITLGEETFAMTAENDVAEKLIRYASRRRVKSAGRKPSWYGA